ncbi:Serine/threonine-protein kinase env7 [Thecaphora frezii]
MSLPALLDRFQDALFALSSCLPCGPTTSHLKLNGRTFSIVKLLGEGGFSFVYLVKDVDSGRLFALKKIRCSYGSASFRDAIKEVEDTKRFRCPNVIQVLDSCVVQDDASHDTRLGNVPASDAGEDGASKVVYLFLPFYQRGNLQDAISAHVVRGTRFGEKEMLTLFHGTCLAVRAMHKYRLPNVAPKRTNRGPRMQVPSPSQQATTPDDADADDDPFGDQHQKPLIDGDQELAEHDAGSYPPRPNAKGKARQVSADDDNDVDGDESAQQADASGAQGAKGGELIPYAHRDIKPANVMISDDGQTPILMDFGSTIKARVIISSRREAVAHQDYAAERSSMPYRAPELFDVPTSCTLTEAVDIWSLGCLLYALAYLHSPFETNQTIEQGGSIALAVLNGSYRFPEQDPYSDATREVIRRCIVVKPHERPDIDEVLELTRSALRGLE